MKRNVKREREKERDFKLNREVRVYVQYVCAQAKREKKKKRKKKRRKKLIRNRAATMKNKKKKKKRALCYLARW